MGCCKQCATKSKENLKLIVLAIGALFAIGASIASFVTALSSYNKLNEIKGDYEVHINHWKSKPLLDVTIVPSNQECPSNYEIGTVSDDRNALQTIGQFPGSNAWCDCRPGGFTWTYTYTEFRCDCGSGKSYNGTTYYTTSWGSGDCSSNAGQAGCSTDSRQQTATETWTTRSGECHPNATSAGCADDSPLSAVSLIEWKEHKVCYKRGGMTAIQRIEYTDIDENGQCSKGVTCQRASATQDVSNTICAETQDQCPIVSLGDITDALAQNNAALLVNAYNKTPSSNENYLPIVEVRTSIGSPCWKGSFGQNGRSNNERVANKYDSGCSRDDTRFIQWDEVNEVTLYNENEVPTSGNNRMGDNSYSEIQYYNTSSDVNWRLSYRHQIFWSSDCEAGDLRDLAWYLGPLNKMVDYQYALLILNGIFGLGILGVILPLITVLHVCDKDNDLPCIPGKGEQERRNLKIIQRVLSLAGKLGKLTPLILCLVVTDNIHWFFMTAGEGNCSDSVTNQAMKELAEQIDIVKESNYTNLYLDIAMICWYIIPLSMWLYKRYCKTPNSKPTETEIVEPAPAPAPEVNVVEEGQADLSAYVYEPKQIEGK